MLLAGGEGAPARRPLHRASLRPHQVPGVRDAGAGHHQHQDQREPHGQALPLRGVAGGQSSRQCRRHHGPHRGAAKDAEQVRGRTHRRARQVGGSYKQDRVGDWSCEGVFWFIDVDVM